MKFNFRSQHIVSAICFGCAALLLYAHINTEGLGMPAWGWFILFGFFSL